MNKMGLGSFVLVAGLSVAGLGCGPKDSSSKEDADVNGVADVEGGVSEKLANALKIVNEERARLAEELSPVGEGIYYGYRSSDPIGVFCVVGDDEVASYELAGQEAREKVRKVYARDLSVVDSFDNESVETVFPNGGGVIVCVKSKATSVSGEEIGRRMSGGLTGGSR